MGVIMRIILNNNNTHEVTLTVSPRSRYALALFTQLSDALPCAITAAALLASVASDTNYN